MDSPASHNQRQNGTTQSHALLLFGFLPLNWALFAVVVIGFATYYYYRRPKGIPPGPNGVPVLGYTPFLGQKPAEKVLELSKQYGNVFSIYLGSQLTVILNDYDAIKTAYNDYSDIFVDRKPGFAHRALNGASNGPINGGPDLRVRGLTMTNGDQWRTMRRFALTTLRNLGMGKSRLQERILEEIDFFCETLRSKKMKPVEPDNLMIACIANIMFAVCFDKRFDHSNPQFKSIVDFLIIALPTLSNIGALQLFPWLRLIPGKFQKFWATFRREVTQLRSIFAEELAIHEKKYKEEHGDVRDYVDAFYDQQQKEGEQGSTPNYFDDDELLVEISNFFGAGAETTATTITWAYYFIVRHPDVQKKMQEEIDMKVGRGRHVTTEDKAKLTYVEAVCSEVARMGSVVPLGIGRSTTEDVQMNGYTIPKGTYIMPNLWFIHHDPKHWGPDANEFKPERFLDSEGRVLNPPSFMPFSIGKRHCPGESLARMEVFLFVTNVLQNFNLRLEEGYTLKPPEDYINGLTTRPPRFDVIFEPRD
ncbi:cytochrome P450 2C15-like [Paramacrobiotus metropolitanus]|uniref:cytochrome P450 2C15-like n=1 Tax=Paramacrobiotus metropolitanus TaxID=2943436 RepID=UPI0024463730|nr:cytochrome P450 2C15-like [Paramacrobiotus metropolitanus]